MGYTTEFEGYFDIKPDVTEEHERLIHQFIDVFNDNVWRRKSERTKELDKDAPQSRCSWYIEKNTNCLTWNGEEKFYEYVEWLEFLIKKFFTPLNYVLSGDVEWIGEDRSDFGTISIKNNTVTVESNLENKRRMKKQIKDMTKLIQERDTYIKYLEEHIKCSPDGELALEAKSDFMKLSLKESLKE